MKILLAEDDPTQLCLLQGLISSWGYDAVLARTGIDAWQALEREDAPQLAVLDGVMPGMSGLDVIRRLRKIDGPAPRYLIVLSAQDSREYIVEALVAGANDFVQKPAHAEELRARIEVGRRVLDLQDRLAKRIAELQDVIHQARLAESKNLQLIAAIEQASEGVVITDSLGAIQYVNDAFVRMTGYAREKVIGRNPRLLKSGQNDPGLYADLWRAIAGGQVWKGELINRRADGALYTEHMSVTPTRDSAGAITNFIAIKKDVTEQKAAQDALRESERQHRLQSSLLRAIFDVSPDGILVVDGQGKILSHNQRFLEIWRIEGADRVGLDDAPLLASVVASVLHPEEFLRRIEALYADPDAYDHCDIELKDGRTIDRTSTPVRDANGKYVGRVWFFRDITERKRAQEALQRSEERARLLFAAIPHAAYVFDLDTLDFLEVNDRAVQRYGHTRDEFMHMKTTEIRPADEAARFREYLRSRPDGESAGQWKHRTKDGRTLDVEISYHAIDYGGRRAALTIAQDVTERKKLELDLRHAQKLESVGLLASGIAHEINTPIQFVGDNLQFLKESFQELSRLLLKSQDLLPLAEANKIAPHLQREIRQMVEAIDLDYLMAEVPKALDQSLEGVGRVATIVTAMKDFAHPDQNRKIAANLNQALTSTLVVARNELKYVADVQTNFGNLPLVACHLGDLNQVFLNLLVNAAHAIAEAVRGTGQRGTIHVDTRQDGDWVRIAISDTGCGIPKEIQGKVFDPFFTTKEVGRGTGQGLAISRSIIVDKHGGTLTFETEIGRGTTFLIGLPIGSPSE